MSPSTTILQLPSLSFGMLSSALVSSSSPLPRVPAKTTSKSPTTNAVLRDEHALLAAYETRPTRPKRSSSERSKEFRAKRKKYEGELQLEVDAMRREVAELTMRRNIWEEKLVHVRSNVSGALIKVVREYYLVFQHGLALAGGANPKAKYQLDFLRQSMDANVRVNDRVGIPALVEMWRQYTVAHANLFVEVGEVTLLGPDDDRVVALCTKVHAQLCRATMEIMFPSALEDQSLVDKFVGKQVTYEARTYFRFNTDGRIGFVDHDLGLFEALLAAAPTVDDALQLMAHFQCPPLARWTIESPVTTEPSPVHHVKLESMEIRTTPVYEHKLAVTHAKPFVKVVKVETPSSDTESDDSESERRKLSMNFLLS